MDIVLSQRMDGYEEGVFQTLNEMVKERRRRNEKVFDFTVGTPDFEAAPYVREAVARAASDPENYKYSLGDMPELIKALTDRYERRYGVAISAENIAGVYGSQEGMAHVAFPFCDPGDTVLVPDPGYPIFSMGPAMAGAKVVKYALYREKNYVLDLADIPDEVADEAKMIIVSYPLNPVCTAAPEDFYRDLIAWAKKHNVLVLHDNAYSDIIFDGRKGISFLSLPGAMEVGAEFYSLSKSYNLTGARVSFLIGNEKMVGSFKRFRSQFDYGLFKVVQYAAIAALTQGDEDVKKQCLLYQKRRDLLCGGLRKLGWDMPDSEGTMFAWSAVPSDMGSVDFVKTLFNKTGVLCTPGVSFGQRGEGYVRFALNHDEETIREALEALVGF